MSIEQELNRAKFHERKGEFIEAKNIYLNILKAFPKNLRVKKRLEKLNITKQTNSSHPPQGLIDNLIKLFNQKKYSLLVDRTEALTEQFPYSFIVWNFLGVAYRSLGKFIEASDSFKKVVKLNPNSPDGFNNLAMAQQALGKLDEALDLSKKALLLKSDSCIFHTNKGIILQEQGKFDESLEAFRKALSFNSKYVEAYYSMANTLLFQDKKDEAIKYFKKSILLNPNYAEAYFNMSVVYKEQGKLNESLEACNMAISLRPNHAESYNNLGVVLKEQGKLDEAIEACKMAISLQPDYAEAYPNLGSVLKEQGELDEAIEACKMAISLQPDQAEAYYNLSFSYNLKGDIQKGLKLYEWRLKKKNSTTRLPRDNLIWDGKQPVSKKKFFVYEEQGLGDTIQFARYLLLLKQKGAEVTFKVQKKMHALLKTLDKDIVLVDSDPHVNNIDFETPLMSLPHLFNTNISTIPSMGAYLSANYDNIISWSKYLTKTNFKVGICWQGSKNRIDVGRSFSLTLFEDLSKLPNVELISLHKGDGEKEIKNINFDLTVLGNNFDSGEDAFVDTAAVIANCDLIITCDTSIAHLSGALGRSTWVVLKKIPDWRWMLSRNDSPWYPNVKLYRQKEYDNWQDIFQIIKKDLKSLISLKEN